MCCLCQKTDTAPPCSVPSPGGFCAEGLLPSALLSPLPAQPGPLFSFLLPLPCFSTTFHILAHPTLSLDKTLVSCYLFFFPSISLLNPWVFPALFVFHHALFAHSAPCSASCTSCSKTFCILNTQLFFLSHVITLYSSVVSEAFQIPFSVGNVVCEIIWLFLPYNAVYFGKAIILSSHHAILELKTQLGGVRVCVGICFPFVSEVS